MFHAVHMVSSVMKAADYIFDYFYLLKLLANISNNKQNIWTEKYLSTKKKFAFFNVQISTRLQQLKIVRIPLLRFYSKVITVW